MNTVRSSPALVDGMIYIGSSDGFLYKLAADDGRMIWKYDAGAAVSDVEEDLSVGRFDVDADPAPGRLV